MSSLGTLLAGVKTELSLLGGVDVQKYADPKLTAIILRVWNTIFNERFWVQQLKYRTFTVDGFYGDVVEPPGGSPLWWGDIYKVWRDDDVYALPVAPMNMNPTHIKQPCILPANNGNLPFVVCPWDWKGSITVAYRQRPTISTTADEVPFDDIYMIQQTVGEYLIGEGTNDTKAQFALQSAKERLKTLIALEQSSLHSLYAANSSTQSEWR